jgi:hypothetical protein
LSADLAISLATAHAVLRLSIAVHLDCPVCHRLPAQKSGSYGGLGKNRDTHPSQAPYAGSLWRS